jgi:hypothetical protein
MPCQNNESTVLSDNDQAVRECDILPAYQMTVISLQFRKLVLKTKA